MSASSAFGFNWKRSLLELMMQQALEEGPAFQSWNKNLIFLIRDVSLNYIRRNTSALYFHNAVDSDPVHFYSYSIEFDEDSQSFDWVADERLSVGLDSIAKVMGSDDYPSQNDFESTLEQKLN